MVFYCYPQSHLESVLLGVCAIVIPISVNESSQQLTREEKEPLKQYHSCDET